MYFVIFGVFFSFGYFEQESETLVSFSQHYDIVRLNVLVNISITSATDLEFTNESYFVPNSIMYFTIPRGSESRKFVPTSPG